MILYIAGMFLILKILTLLKSKTLNWRDAGLYTAGWIGMNPEEFIQEASIPHKWLPGAVSFLTGTVLLFISLSQDQGTLRAVYLFTAMLFIFHFGLLDLNARLWNFLGRSTKPIMNAPWKALNLADFWGKRWNLAFRDAAHLLLFTPFRKKMGTKTGLFTVFIFSGIVHETVISVPARGGYGGPMLYFLIQFSGLLLQKKYVCLNNRLTTWLILTAPLPLLFHQPFFLNVFIPLSNTIGG